jgi:hypothetical protein
MEKCEKECDTLANPEVSAAAALLGVGKGSISHSKSLSSPYHHQAEIQSNISTAVPSEKYGP